MIPITFGFVSVRRRGINFVRRGGRRPACYLLFFLWQTAPPLCLLVDKIDMLLENKVARNQGVEQHCTTLNEMLIKLMECTEYVCIMRGHYS
ncbi:hypothetical protein T01_5602 [Trichinella spiralis]|uniref:Uncharacterized protein n=1 Tax=Trichinella spiralis TaxID=6334 RepID=A0A0V1BLX6_TRISP|nr:hypothetical protein T01_5602 [Trichinella spiralis]